MVTSCPTLQNGSPLVVGSAAASGDLESSTAETLKNCCDLLEVRLDLLNPEESKPWQHLAGFPILFTARRGSEGGAKDLTARQRIGILSEILDEASLIDIEVASIREMSDLIRKLGESKLPWIASFHDFQTLPEDQVLEEAAAAALDAGAQVFKLAAHLNDSSALKRLIEFQQADHGIATATMGMGPLAGESRLRCAEAGSVLNYGYLSDTPTAPGQWSASQLKQAIEKLGSL